jgi:formylglycine-generating enzyme required for sulfatase activity
LKVGDILADIFLSYAREDLAKAKLLAAALEKQGWSVFWDRTSILAGQDFDDIIEKAIDAAKCMIVVWSETSKKSYYVRDEARKARDRNILVPILVEPVNPPLGFGSIHADNFAAWNGDTQSDEFNKLLRAVTRLVGSATDSNQTPAVNANTPLLASFPKQATSGSKTSVVSNKTFLEPEMVVIPAGSFQMGSNNGSDNERPVHSVRLKSFAIGRYEVTFDEYDQFAVALGKPKPKDMGWGRGKRPVINVSWEDAVAYAQWLSSVTGKPFRLPTEAEWEYAARAGINSAYFWGEKACVLFRTNIVNDAENFAWFSENSGGKTHPVGEKRPNAFKLYDMAGNVFEWVEDCWHDNYQDAPSDESSWQGGDSPGRVLRGGSWGDEPVNLRSATRYWLNSGISDPQFGFRLAQD